VRIRGEPEETERIFTLFHLLQKKCRENKTISSQDVSYGLNMLRENRGTELSELSKERIVTSSARKPITPKSIVQMQYVRAIKRSDIVVGIGPAGTGKTYLAVAMGVSYLRAKKIARIILVRPAVEAGENLGFLPGDLKDKVDPYIRPLYDALYEMMGPEKIHKLLEMGVIEILPLAFMRGRTLNNSFVILDEGQNSTRAQMKMFLTRLGLVSKAVITGDITQIDLHDNAMSGLIHIQNILANIEGIDFIYFSEKDVVRHALVQKIIRAYEKSEINTDRK
jgi:phosphate starvation-inducible PhoH-like protein